MNPDNSMLRFKPLREEGEAYFLPHGPMKYYTIENLKDLIIHLTQVKHTLETWRDDEND